MATPSTGSLRYFDIPLSSTMYNKHNTPQRSMDSGLASGTFSLQSASENGSHRILESTTEECEVAKSSNHHTPHSGFMFLKRNLLNRNSSTPRGATSLCPFSTPDRLSEPFISHEAFEHQLQVIKDKNSFSPCIDWQSTMNPEVFDTSNPAAYLPPTKSRNDDQNIQRAINSFFQKQILPSPKSTQSNRRKSTLCAALTRQNLTSENRACTIATQTKVTIPPKVNLDDVFAQYMTYEENDTRVSLMDLSQSSSSSGGSLCSLSRRKLFTEDGLVIKQNTTTDFSSRTRYSFDETVALSSPPKSARQKNSTSDEENDMSAFNSREARENSIREISPGGLDIDLSPIRRASDQPSYSQMDEDMSIL